MSEFLSTVEEIESLTQLRFSDEVRAADVRGGLGVESALDVGLNVLLGADKEGLTPHGMVWPAWFGPALSIADTELFLALLAKRIDCPSRTLHQAR